MGPSRLRIAVAVGTAIALTACADGVAPTRFLTPGASLGSIPNNKVGDGVASGELVEVCKEYRGTVGPVVAFHVVGPGVDTTFNLGHLQCANVFLNGGAAETATVTETVPAGYTASWVRTVTTTGTEPEVAGNVATGDAGGAPSVVGTLIRFYNTEIPQEEGCTYTQGYWKTHSTYGPAGPADDGWANVGGPDAAFFSSGLSWYELFWTPVAGRKYVSLAHQYMAAKLNVLNGADDTDIAAALAAAEAWFPGKSLTAVPPTNAWQSAFAAFNEGSTGPGHCEDEVIS